MPFLQFDTTVEMTGDDERAFARTVRELYGEIMQTGTDHVAIVVRSHQPNALSIGRATGADRLLVLDADIREGRSFDSKRELVIAVMDLAADEFGIPEPNMKAVITEHAGAQMMGYDRVGSEWSPTEGDSD